MQRTALTLSVLLAFGCGGSTEESASSSPEHSGDHHAGGHHAEAEASADAPQPTEVLADGSRLFGQAFGAERDETALGDILAAPDQFDGQVVKTSGEIVSVCQSMGCWMEIRADVESPGVRVPMAGHSFFLPRDLAGSRATVEGTVAVAALSAEDREHLESEGATAAGQEVSIEATGVVVHP